MQHPAGLSRESETLVVGVYKFAADLRGDCTSACPVRRPRPCRNQGAPESKGIIRSSDDEWRRTLQMDTSSKQGPFHSLSGFVGDVVKDAGVGRSLLAAPAYPGSRQSNGLARQTIRVAVTGIKRIGRLCAGELQGVNQ